VRLSETVSMRFSRGQNVVSSVVDTRADAAILVAE
jgi:hypothetical protein